LNERENIEVEVISVFPQLTHPVWRN
jgi:hypothetical protein